MHISKIKLTNFRNFSTREFQFQPEINVICGENGVGKTNLLEAIYFLSCAKSFRVAKDSDIILFGEDNAFIDSEFFAEKREQTLSVSLFKSSKKSLSLNYATLESPRELMGIIPSVLFRPEELSLLRGGASMRRSFLDNALCQLRPRYLLALSQYRRLHDGKQKLLRRSILQPSFAELLPDYNRRMADIGAVISSFRKEFCEKIAPIAKKHHNEISNGKEEISLLYQTNANNAEETFLHMQARRDAELARVACLVGVHKDDICVSLGERPIREFGSQGQTRTAVIAMKLAVRDVFCEEFRESPLLLLDDVLSELDDNRQNYLLENTSGAQVFITCCENSQFSRKFSIEI